MKLHRAHWWLAVLLGFPLALFCLGAMKNFLIVTNAVYPKNPERGKDAKFLEMQEVLFFQHEGEKETIRVEASRISTSDSDVLIDLEGISASLERQSKGSSIKVSSKEARYETPKGILTLMGEAQIITPDGYTLTGEVFRYFEKFDRIKTSEAVTFKGPGIAVSGGGFMYDLKTGDFRIGGRGRVVCDFAFGDENS